MTAERLTARVRITQGMIEGTWEGEVASFRGIPYAEPPTGELRWAPPVRAASWDGTRAATEPGPIAPQPPSRLEAVMGPMGAPPMSEDCLNLNAWTPAPGSAERLPTLVFIHGGGYMSGSGSAAWHDGRPLAARGPALVVTINYRLGALGYLYLPPELSDGETVANAGLLDQRSVLEWVRENAAALGGDPENVTVFGQSGGAHSVIGLAALDGAVPFSRAIFESAPLGMVAADREAAAATAATFLRATGVKDGLRELRELPAKRVLEAQRETVLASLAFGAVLPPFQLVTDGEVLRREPVAAAMAGSTDRTELLLGFTREDASAFFCADDATWQLSADELTTRLAKGRGASGTARFNAYLARSTGPPAAALAEMVTDEMMIAPAVRLAEARAARGVDSHLFRFSWAPDANRGRLGSCHTIELPFVFGNPADWADAPMLRDHTSGEIEDLSAIVQDAWLAFAATGDPGGRGLGEWPGLAVAATTMELDLEPRLIDDPSDGRRDLWP